jgi:hypothetical protein
MGRERENNEALQLQSTAMHRDEQPWPVQTFVNVRVHRHKAIQLPDDPAASPFYSRAEL